MIMVTNMKIKQCKGYGKATFMFGTRMPHLIAVIVVISINIQIMCDARMTIMIRSMTLTMFVNLLVTTRCTARRSLLPMSVVAKRRPLVANTCNQLPEM